MADTSFEFKLERMFAEAPDAADAELFALRVLERLDRGWTARRFVIGAMGALGGLIGAYELLGVGGAGAGRVRRPVDRANDSWRSTSPDQLGRALLPAGIQVDGQAIWTGGGAGALSRPASAGAR